MARLIDITGKALSGEWGNDDTEGTGIPVLRTTNFTNDGIINFDSVVTRSIPKKDLTQKYLRTGDIIIEKSGGSDKQPVGRVVYYDGPESTYLCTNFTGVLRVQATSRWLPRYVPSLPIICRVERGDMRIEPPVCITFRLIST